LRQVSRFKSFKVSRLNSKGKDKINYPTSANYGRYGAPEVFIFERAPEECA
jgi:hypothetical protein